MEEIKEFILKELKNKGIYEGCLEALNESVELGVISEHMNLTTALNTFLVYQSEKHPVFKSILKRQRPFDISCEIEESVVADAILLVNEFLEKTGKLEKVDEDPINSTITGLQPLGEQLEGILRKILSNRMEYIFIQKKENTLCVGIKLSTQAYEAINDTAAVRPIICEDLKAVFLKDIPYYLIPYYLILKNFADISCVHFDEFIFDHKILSLESKPDKVFLELIEHLKDIRLPLTIASYELFNGSSGILPVYNAYITLDANNSWPKSEEAARHVKAALYCQYYLKSSHSVYIDRECVVFNYKGIFFSVKAFPLGHFSAKSSIQGRIQEKIVGGISRKARLLRALLGNLGFYPFVIDDLLVDSLALILSKGITGDACFTDAFLSFGWALGGKCLMLDDVRLVEDYGTDIKFLRIAAGEQFVYHRLPSHEALSELRDICGKLKGSTPTTFKIQDSGNAKMLVPCTINIFETAFANYDFILSKNKQEGFEQIDGYLESLFTLGTPIASDFIGKYMAREAEFRYDPCNEILLVRVKEGIDRALLSKILITETSFRYIKYAENN